MKKLTSLSMGMLLCVIACSVIYYGCKKKDETPAATCSDGIQNQGETGVDCGGPCTACATCSDGIQNQGETAIDCGGPCPACPVASMSANVDGTPWTANYINAYALSGSLIIQASYLSTTHAIQIIHSGTFAPGTYSLGGLSGSYAESTPSTVNCIIQTGTITFTQFNTTTKTVSGTFSFSCTDPSTTVSQSITSGVFTNVKY